MKSYLNTVVLKFVQASVICTGLFCITLAAQAEGRMKVNPYGKMFEGANGLITIEMAVLEEKNEFGIHDVIMRMTGFYPYQEGIDGQAILYKVHRSGPGIDYRIKKNGKDYTRMVSRKGWGNYENLTVNLDRQDFPVSYLEESSKDVRPKHLVTALKESAPYPNKYPQVNPYGIAFRSNPAGLTIELAELTEKNEKGLRDIIVVARGAPAYEAGIDGKPIRYQAAHGGNGIDYRYKMDGKWSNRLTLRKSPWSSQRKYQIHLANKSYDLSVDRGMSGEVRPVHLWSALN